LNVCRMLPVLATTAIFFVMGAPAYAQQAATTQDYTRISSWSSQIAQNSGPTYDSYRVEPINLLASARLTPQEAQRRANEPVGHAVPQDGRTARRSPMDNQYDNRITTRGTVTKSTRSTMVVRTDSGRYVVFSFEPDAERPQSIAVGSRVRVVSRPSGDGVQVASYVAADTGGADAGEDTGAYGARADRPVPDDVPRLERQIARQARRFRTGVRAGAGLDPEILTAGVHATMGPFFNDDIWFRPNAEFGFGEVTTMFAINLEAIY